MPAPIQKDYDLHAEVLEYLQYIKPRLQKGDQIILDHGTKPLPYAKITALNTVMDFPIPLYFGVYKDAKTWLTYYLECQIALVADSIGVEVLRLTSFGNLVKLNRNTTPSADED